MKHSEFPPFRRHRLVAVLSLTLGLMAPAQGLCGAPPKAAVLFNGTTLSGWKGNARVWSVRDGTIVGSALQQPVNYNTFLITEKEYENFVLTLKFKLSKGNSGIQFRSLHTGNREHFVVKGYQADLSGEHMGNLYDEGRRGELVKARLESTLHFTNPNQWNTCEIRAVGNRIQLRINQRVTARYIEKDDKIARTGVIALQTHGGTEIAFKDIQLQEIKEIKPKKIF